MAHDHDVLVGIEFLVSPRRDVAHRNVLCSFDAGGFIFPRLANIEQHKCFSALLQRLDLTGRNFEVHRSMLSVETARPVSFGSKTRQAASLLQISLYSCEARVHFAA